MTTPSNRTGPLVSIIIPVYSDPEGLQTTLQSAVKQYYNPFEIIVSITPSSGETLKIAKEYASNYSELIRIVEVQESGRARARNAGIKESNGEVIAFVDADISMYPDWLENSISDMQAKRGDCLACNVVTLSSTGNSGFIEKYDMALSIPLKHYITNYHFAPTAALLLTRDLIEDVGYFNPELMSSEDREFGNRVYERGYEIYVSDCKVYHPPRKKMSEQTQKAIRIGVGIEQLRRQYPDRYPFPSLMSPLSYAPPSPKRLKSRFSSNNYKPDALEWVSFYLLNYFLKLHQQLGRWRQYLNQ